MCLISGHPSRFCPYDQDAWIFKRGSSHFFNSADFQSCISHGKRLTAPLCMPDYSASALCHPFKNLVTCYVLVVPTELFIQIVVFGFENNVTPEYIPVSYTHLTL